jgi:hypothetical protein
MRYLNRPSPAEELSVRGRYECADEAGVVWGAEDWEWFRFGGSQEQVWRSEWQGEWAGQRFTLLGQAVVSPEGLERLKMRLERAGQPAQAVTLTTMPDSILAHYDEAVEEVELPVGYAVFALARLAFPFDLASEQRELAMTYYLRPSPPARPLSARPVKFEYTPLGLQVFTVKGQEVRAKGWRMVVPGLPTQEAWFERNGTCLLWRVEGSWQARLVEWQTFG